MRKTNHPRQHEGRDPLFVELERKLDSSKTRRIVEVCIYGAMYAMALFIFACLSDFAGAGEWVYKYGGSW